ncbi:gamma-glutamyl-gamma-aminobutyrate hydrolase family protein [Tepidamorphus sp. 3E244]|uniref:gamma-glutamyl-gamma-aminobutyrate hydrolase family protein n=1 Tax=Tepidamorphus sp. 3E244 TaxID=3385498 RepID=UPI0038FC1339
MSKRPTIAVTLSRGRSYWVWLLHRLAIWRAGGKAMKVTPGDDYDMGAIDGLVVGGGDDISFQLDGTELDPNVRYDPERDALEREMLVHAFEQNIPVLGVCRGAQMINLVRGGTLWRDIVEINKEAPKGRMLMPRKRITFVEDSRLADIMKCNPCQVNALHHQAVNKPGEGLRIVAHDEYEIVQAIEAPDHDFTIGVQWHPEMLPFSKPNMNLFRALVSSIRQQAA